MATTELTGATAYPLDDGIGSVSDGAELMDSAGTVAATAGHAGGSYREAGAYDLSNANTTNNTVDISAGRAYVEVSGADIQTDRSGASSPSYDATLADPVPVGIELHSAVSAFSLEAGVNDLYLVLDTDGATTGTAGNVYIEYGTAIATPSKPSLWLGQADTTNGTTTGYGGRNEIYDSTGRYLGELTGTNDAQTIIDAIADRVAGASLILPNPGFDLDIEQQIDYPVQEEGFGIETLGTPRLVINGSFTDSYVINWPAGSGDFYGDRNYHLGPVHLDNGPNGVSGITAAIRLVDKRQWWIWSPFVTDMPGIKVEQSNRFTSDGMIINGQTSSGTGPAIQFGDICNANYVYNHNFRDAGTTSPTETAFIDRGNHNHWLNSRCEFAQTVHEADGANGYYIRTGDWDRPNSSFTYSLVEKNGASGYVKFTGYNKGENFDISRIHSPKTEVDLFGIQADDYGRKVTHYGEAMNKLLRNVNFPGDFPLWRSVGNTAPIVGGAFGGGLPLLQFISSADGDVVNLETNGFIADPSIRSPKVQIGRMGAISASSGITFQMGFADGSGPDPSNRIEWVYDPDAAIGTFAHGNTNWHFDVKTGGTERGSTDALIDASTVTNWFSIDLDAINGEAAGNIAAGTYKTHSYGGTQPGEMFFRMRLGDTAGAKFGATVNFDPQEGFQLIAV